MDGLRERVETISADAAAHGCWRAQFADKDELDRFRLRLEEVERRISTCFVEGMASEECKLQIEAVSSRLDSLVGQCSAGSDAERERRETIRGILSLLSGVGDSLDRLKQRASEAEKSHESLCQRVSQMSGSRAQRWKAGY